MRIANHFQVIRDSHDDRSAMDAPFRNFFWMCTKFFFARRIANFDASPTPFHGLAESICQQSSCGSTAPGAGGFKASPTREYLWRVCYEHAAEDHKKIE
jgi:hypothetical protein